MNIKYADICEAGARSNNEDSCRIIDLPEINQWMGIICDGLGGHAMGEVASETVVSAISEYWNKHSNISNSSKKIKAACEFAIKELDKRADTVNRCQMGTTMVMASIQNDSVSIANIGDSRCYIMRKGYSDYEDILNADNDNVVYQTNDHIRIDFGWEIVSRCFFSYDASSTIPDIVQFDLKKGDRIFLCSDGIYKCIAPKILKSLIMDNKSPEEILDVLKFLCEKKSEDNYTAILAFIT